ncbi:hypothetical protein [Flavobacterium sp. FlaQc-50]|uniref:hypothetical protein n=1 Tax=unclassified Flavobacterium TaxID=196869 RepID=UPI003756E6AF
MTAKALAKTDDFYNWFKEMGGNMITKEPEKLNENLHKVPLQVGSTLKANAQRIKEMYNHKFKQNGHY